MATHPTLPNDDASARTHWLSLHEAASRLGVHPTTLRAWADAGHIAVVRTPGGHRRFAEDDVTRLLIPESVGADSPAVSPTDAAGTASAHATIVDRDQTLVPAENGLQSDLLQQTRADLAGERDHAGRWLVAFDEEQRHMQRETGRRLLGLAIQYMVRDRKRKQILLEGRTLAAWYGSSAAVQGLSLADLTRAFMFFRDSLGDAVTSQVHDPARDPIPVRLREFMDEVLYAAMDAYDATRLAAADGS